MFLQKSKLSALTVCIMFLFLGSVNAQEKDQEKGDKNMDEMWGSTSVVKTDSEKSHFFDDSNFGMFIHWGLYSKLAGDWKDKTYYGIGEWIMNPRVADISPEEYKKTAKEFNPTKFNGKAIAQLAKDAGMKYIIITSKHHEGFAMFDSKVSDFNIVDSTPFARDPMKELAQACHELGLGFGFYYSHNQDWTAPGGTGGPKTDENGKDVTFKEYFYEKCKPQVREICTNYGEIDFVWFDTPGGMPEEYVVELAEMVRELQPNAMMSSRVGYGMGDYSTNGDMEVPSKNIEGLWETCDTNNDSWSYAWYDNNFKRPTEILNRLISTVGRGGTYLFNVGPNGDGEIPEIGVKFLKETGAWLRKYPQVVYGAGPSPWGHALPWGDVTTKDHSLFLSVIDWPSNGKLYLPGLESEIETIKFLGASENKKVSYSKENNWVIIDVPYQPLDSLISVIEIQLKNPANEAKVTTNLGLYPNTETTYLVEFGKTTNAEMEYIRWMEKFGEWKHTYQVSDWEAGSNVTWEVNVQEPGYYYLDLSYAGTGRLVWKTVTDEGVKVQNQQAATEKYVYYPMGIVEFKTAGNHTISVSLVEGDVNTSSLKGMKLRPVQ